MKDVFVSFQTGDDGIARQAADYLEHEGWSCWRCTNPADNIPGTAWTRSLTDALMAAGVVLVLYSARAVRSPHVFREVSMSVSAEKTVLVVRLDDTPFPPEWLYWVRTTQMLNVQTQSPAEWFPGLGNALRTLLPLHCALPVDSIADRRLKVRFCVALHREVFKEARVRMLGATVRLKGVVRLHLASPQRTSQQMRAVEHALAALAETRADPAPGCCVPFRASEDTFFVICIADSPAAERRASKLLRALPKMLAEAIPGPAAGAACDASLDAEIRILQSVNWEPRDGEDALAAFFSNTGCEVPRPKSGGKRLSKISPVMDRFTKSLLAKVWAASIPADGGRQLPCAMTFSAAEERLRIILTAR